MKNWFTHRVMTMASKKQSIEQYIDLKLPSIMGMGAIGPTLATLTAALYGALCVADATPPRWGYPVIMLVLSGLLAVFPVFRVEYNKVLKICLWPIATAIIFATAWGANNGLSAGEQALSQVPPPDLGSISLVSSAYAQDPPAAASTNPMFKDAVYNQVPFHRVDMKSKAEVPQQPFKTLPKDTWGVSWAKRSQAYLKDNKGVWWAYQLKPAKPPVQQQPEPPPQQQQGGFFKRF